MLVVVTDASRSGIGLHAVSRIFTVALCAHAFEDQVMNWTVVIVLVLVMTTLWRCPRRVSMESSSSLDVATSVIDNCVW